MLLRPLRQYQSCGFERFVLPFCDVMETFNQTSVSTTDNRGTSPAIAPSSGIALTYNITTAFSAFLTGLAQEDHKDHSPPTNSINLINRMSWIWQTCSEYGFYKRGNPADPHNIVSRFYSLDLFQSQCNEAFPTGDRLPARPEVQKVNIYGGWDINPSKTMFTDGEFDPWRSLSPNSPYVEVGAPNRRSVQGHT